MIKFVKHLSIIILILSFAQLCIAQDIQEELVTELKKNKNIKNPYKKYNYNFEDTKRTLIELQIISDVKSEKDLVDGQTLVFRSCTTIHDKSKIILKKGDLVYAKVETTVKNGMNGIPASIILSNFKFDNIPTEKITGSYEKYGQDRSIIVYPIKWTLTPLPGAGTLTNFIKGGHAKIKENDIIEIYYHPNW